MIKESQKNTVHRLILYQEHKKRAVILREEIAFAGPKTTAGYSLAPGGSGTSDSTGQLASRVGDKLSLQIGLYDMGVVHVRG